MDPVNTRAGKEEFSDARERLPGSGAEASSYR